MSNSFGLTEDQIKFVKKILSIYIPDAKVYAFGSRARGDYKRYSDLDLAIESSMPISKKIWLNIQEQFSESSLPIKVDLVELSQLDLEFKAKIQAELTEI